MSAREIPLMRIALKMAYYPDVQGVPRVFHCEPQIDCLLDFAESNFSEMPAVNSRPQSIAFRSGFSDSVGLIR